jgi:hypothetical protein
MSGATQPVNAPYAVDGMRPTPHAVTRVVRVGDELFRLDRRALSVRRTTRF